MRSKTSSLACWLVASMSGLGCSKHSPPGEGIATAANKSVAAPPASQPPTANSPLPTRQPQTQVPWTYPDTPIGPMNAVVVVPARTAEERFPVLLTFHGTGEARKGPEKGARGWIDDYGLYRAIERLQHPPLTAADLEGIADPERLAKLNAA